GLQASGPGGTLRIDKFVAGTFTALATTSAGVDNDPVWMRARVVGDELKLKIWRYGSPEPSSWALEATDNSLAAPGYVGVSTFARATWHLIAVGVGTGGDPAPDSPVDPGDDDELTATGLDVLSAVGAPSLSQLHGLVALGIDAGCDVGLPSLSQAHGLAALGIDIDADLGLPDVGQGHALTATGLSVASDLGTPEIGQHHA